MNLSTFLGVFQRMTITEQTPTRLVLRELPLLEWLFAGSIFLSGMTLLIASLEISAGVAVALGVFFAAQGRIRSVLFDVGDDTMTVIYQTIWGQRVAQQVALEDIQRAYLNKDESGATQIILVQRNGAEQGLSVYSLDVRDWKEAIVIAINALLHEAHKDAASPAEAADTALDY